MSDTARSPRSGFAWDWVGGWTLVFVANLPFPLLFSWKAVQEGGGFGLFGAVAVLYLVGVMACGLPWWAGRALCWGGAVVAASQCFPILQIFAGHFATMFWDDLSGTSRYGGGMSAEGKQGWELVRANFGVCVVVFLTGVPLMTLALFVGAGIRLYRGDYPIFFARRIDPDAELE